ncbi:FAD-dependent monooxygenase [Dactylosporangium sp. NPDC051484]|uniref:FAD-dependent monooxygenase n=1 Tax=Dactylosporangium sp. NPDC051484 TaxID=3154942 RepID=UPI00344B2AD6
MIVGPSRPTIDVCVPLITHSVLEPCVVVKHEINRGWRTVDTVEFPRAEPPRETSVLVVGAGPSGLASALELSRNRVEVAVVDAATSASLVRAGAMSHTARVVELFRRWGVLDAIREGWTFPPEWNTGNRLRTSLVGHDLGPGPSRSFGKRHGSEYSFEDPIRRPQTVLQQAFLRKLAADGVPVAGGWRVVELHDNGTGITTVVEHVGSGERREVRARYVIGADGGRSDVRRLSGIERDGERAAERHFRFIVRVREYPADIGLTLSGTNVVVNERFDGFLAAISDHEWRLYAGPYPLGAEPAEAELLELANAAFGTRVDAEIVSLTPFYKSTRIARTFRKGRVLLVGDAAHVRAPGGNLGEGFGDVANVGWKVAAVLRGDAGEVLLDSYDEERRTHNHRVASVAQERAVANERAIAQARALGFPSDDDLSDGAHARRAQIGAVLRGEAGPQDGVIFDERYDTSPVIWHEPAGPGDVPAWDPRRYTPTARPGHRAPNGNIDPFGGTVYDRLGSHLALLVLSDEHDTVEAFQKAAAERSIEIDVIQLDDADARAVYGARYALLRPDHHVAWRGNGTDVDPGTILDHVLGVAKPS